MHLLVSVPLEHAYSDGAYSHLLTTLDLSGLCWTLCLLFSRAVGSWSLQPECSVRSWLLSPTLTPPLQSNESRESIHQSHQPHHHIQGILVPRLRSLFRFPRNPRAVQSPTRPSTPPPPFGITGNRAMERILFSLTSEPLTTLVAPLVTCDSSSFSSAPHVYLYRPPLLRSNLLRRPTARPKLPSVSSPPAH